MKNSSITEQLKSQEPNIQSREREIEVSQNSNISIHVTTKQESNVLSINQSNNISNYLSFASILSEVTEPTIPLSQEEVKPKQKKKCKKKTSL